MANNKIFFENPLTGKMKEAPVGSSWTSAFFGPFPMLFRGAWKWLAITFLLALFTWGLSGVVFMFIINKIYIKDLVSDGYKAKGVESGTLDEVSMKLGFKIPTMGDTAPNFGDRKPA